MNADTGSKFVCFHIGLPKTGTTFIQQSVFKSSKHIISYYNRLMINNYFKTRTGINLRNIFRSPVGIWEGGPFISTFDKLLYKQKKSSKKVCLISDENFSVNSNFFDLENQNDLEPDKLIHHLKTLEERALDLGFAEIKVLLMTRERGSWLASRYAQSGPKIENPGQEDFEERIINILQRSDLEGTKFEWLDYANVIRKFDSAFGTNFKVIPFETFRQDKRQFMDQLNRFLGVNLNYENSENAIKSRKRSSGQWEVAGHPEIYIELKEKTKQLINSKFQI